jgi:hypothetical protein
MTEAPTLAVVGRDERLGLSASWGSWCSLGQTHERSHADVIGMRARFCIYLKGLQAGFRLRSSLAVLKGVPNDGSKWTEMRPVGLVAVLVDFVGAAEHSKVLQAVVE